MAQADLVGLGRKIRVLRLGVGLVRMAKLSAVQADVAHRGLAQALLREGMADELHHEVHLFLHLRRGQHVVRAHQLEYLHERRRHHVLHGSDRSREHVRERHRRHHVLVAAGKEDRLLAEAALQALHVVECRARVLHPLHVGEVEVPHVARRVHVPAVGRVDEERQIGGGRDEFVVVVHVIGLLSVVHRRHGGHPVAARLRRKARQRHRVVRVHATHVRDQLRAPVCRLGRARIDACPFLNGHQQALARAARQVEPAHTVRDAELHQSLDHLLVEAQVRLERREERRVHAFHAGERGIGKRMRVRFHVHVLRRRQCRRARGRSSGDEFSSVDFHCISTFQMDRILERLADTRQGSFHFVAMMHGLPPVGGCW